MKKIIVALLTMISASGIHSQTSYSINTIVGSGSTGYTGDGGSAILSTLFQPSRVCCDTAGNIYITDSGNHCIRKVGTTGIITTVAGTGVSGFSGDGGNATVAQLNDPQGVCIDTSGALYIVDGMTRIRKVDKNGIISTYAGNGTTGFSGDGGLAISAQFNGANGIAIDVSGNIYVTDYYNNRIRKITPSGIISTIAGTGTSGYTGDGGPANSAQIAWLAGITVDNVGNVYITDNANNVVRKINTSGIITTVAGNGTGGFSGDNGPAISAQLSNPYSLAIDASYNLFISDYGNNRIRVVNTNSVISTIAGNGTSSFGGDGGSAISASLNGPNGIAEDGFGKIYFVDSGNNRVRALIPNTILSIEGNVITNNSISLYPIPNNGLLHFRSNTRFSQGKITLINSIGQIVFEQDLLNTYEEIDIHKLGNGLYDYQIVQDNVLIKTGKITVN